MCPQPLAPQTPELIALLACTDLTAHIVVRYGYRQARIIGDAVTDGPFEYSGGDDFHRLQERLAAATGDRVDNPEAYEVLTPDDQVICLWFHDWKVAVGPTTQPY